MINKLVFIEEKLVGKDAKSFFIDLVKHNFAQIVLFCKAKQNITIFSISRKSVICYYPT